MRKKLITFADITKVYNELYFKNSNYRIQQKVVSERSRRIISKIDNNEFVEFLKAKGIDAEKELKFFKKAIRPIKNKETKFKYKTFCLIITIIILRHEENTIIENIEKNIFTEKDNLRLSNNYLLKDKVNKKKDKVILISLKNFEDSKRRRVKRRKIKLINDVNKKNIKLKKINYKRGNRKIRFQGYLNEGIDISFRIIMCYIEFLKFKAKYVDIKLANDFLKIIDMDYLTKCNLLKKINKLIFKEMNKNENYKVIGRRKLSDEEIDIIIENNYADFKKEILIRLIKDID